MRKITAWLLAFVVSFGVGTAVDMLGTNIAVIQYDTSSLLFMANQIDDEKTCKICEIYIKELVSAINQGYGNLSHIVKDSDLKEIRDSSCREIKLWPHRHSNHTFVKIILQK